MARLISIIDIRSPNRYLHIFSIWIWNNFSATNNLISILLWVWFECALPFSYHYSGLYFNIWNECDFMQCFVAVLFGSHLSIKLSKYTIGLSNSFAQMLWISNRSFITQQAAYHMESTIFDVYGWYPHIGTFYGAVWS